MSAAPVPPTQTAGVTGPRTVHLTRSPPIAKPGKAQKLLHHPLTGAVRAARLPAAVVPATTRTELSGQMSPRKPAAKSAPVEGASPRLRLTSSIVTSTATCTPRTRTKPESASCGKTEKSLASKRYSNPSRKSSRE